jgi:hypothetical protein
VLNKYIYNFDNTGYIISIVTSFIVIASANYSAVYVNNSINQKLFTFTEYIFIKGYHVPLIIIFKGTYYLRKYFKNNINSDIH